MRFLMNERMRQVLTLQEAEIERMELISEKNSTSVVTSCAFKLTLDVETLWLSGLPNTVKLILND